MSMINSIMSALKAGNGSAALESMIQQVSAEKEAQRSAVYSSGRVGRFKTGFGESHSVLMPIELALPFDLATGEEDLVNGWSRKRPQVLQASFTSAVKILRLQAARVPAVKEKVLSLLGKSKDDDFLELDGILDMEVENIPRLSHDKIVELHNVFSRFHHHTETVQAVRSSGNKYPQRFLSDASVDEVGRPIPAGFISKASKLESSLVAIRCDAKKKEMEEANAQEQQIKNALEAIRNDRFLSEPMLETVMFCVDIPIEKNNGAIKKGVKDVITKKDITPLMRWWRLPRTQIVAMSKFLGDPINDLHDDYLEIIWECPPLDPGEVEAQAQYKKAKITAKEATKDNCYFTLEEGDRKEKKDQEAIRAELQAKVNAGTASPEEIDALKDCERALSKIVPVLPPDLVNEKFQEWMDSEEAWDEATYKKLPDFRIKSESEIKQIMKDALPAYNEELLTSNIISTYQDLILEIDTSVGTDAAIAAATGSVKVLTEAEEASIKAEEKLIEEATEMQASLDDMDIDISTLESLED